jgi:xanthine dehydrogenase iron-sulfur cluster and FAD-binding subunit A
MVVNGVAATPYRLNAVEAFIKGKARDKATADQAAEMAVEGAVPLLSQRLQDSIDEGAREARHSWRLLNGPLNDGPQPMG